MRAGGPCDPGRVSTSRFVSLVLLVTLAGCGKDEPPSEVAKATPAPKPAPAPTPTPAHEPELPPDPAAIVLADRVELERYRSDLEFIAATRSPGSPHWQLVQDRCAAVLGEAGFTVERFAANPGGTNVIGTRLGSAPELPAIVVGAHYDHIEDCAGADDNASGTAALLELARVLGPAEHAWQRTLIMACWDEEELGLLGSKAWVDAQIAAGKRFELYVNFDAMGYADSTPRSQTLPPGVDLLFAKQLAELEARDYRADFIALLADERAAPSAARALAHARRIELPALMLAIPSAMKNEPALADIRRSDHASFWTHDVPALFFSDTAEFRTNTYHCKGRPDTADTVDVAFATKVVRASAGMLAELLVK